MNDRFVMFTLNEIKGTLDGANPKQSILVHSDTMMSKGLFLFKCKCNSSWYSVKTQRPDLIMWVQVGNKSCSVNSSPGQKD